MKIDKTKSKVLIYQLKDDSNQCETILIRCFSNYLTHNNNNKQIQKRLGIEISRDV